MTDVKTAEAALAKAKATGDREKIRAAQLAAREARWQARKGADIARGALPADETTAGTHAEYLAAVRAARTVPATDEPREGDA